jgi:thiol-disulfide isomerase/thioredoxin
MRYSLVLLAWLLLAAPLIPQDTTEDGPTNEKAQKTYKEAIDYLHKRMPDSALDSFKKADKQDGGHCVACQRKMIKYGMEYGDWKTAEFGAQEMVNEAQGDKALALAHYGLGFVFFQEGVTRHKDELFVRAHDEMTKALAAYSVFSAAIFVDGRALAYMKQDDAARARFQQYAQMRPPEDPDRQRALRFISEPELARARMAPPFAITTTDGQRLSLDDLKGKVVLIDFWATWCAPCREALPHVKSIAGKFQGQPLVVLSVSLDTDDQKWKDFIAQNQMNWPQYRDLGFTGAMAKLFGVEAIPHTFTVDADGVLQDEHIGDADIEGKLKKLIARAQESQSAQKAN